MTEPKEPFVARWSRLKIEARQTRPETRQSPPEHQPNPPAEARPQPAASDAQASPAKVLPPVESLQGLASEYREFLHPEVDDGLRQAALKKLFSDPHFNTMDGLDVYIDDYGKPDPIPEAMLKTLEHAKGLIFDREDAQGVGDKEALAQASQPDRSGSAPGPESAQNKTDEGAPTPESPAGDNAIQAAPPPTPGTKS